MEKRRVVITGIGAVTPLGNTAAESWQAVKDGVCGIAPITLYDHSNQKVSLAAEVKNFDPTVALDKPEPGAGGHCPLRRVRLQRHRRHRHHPVLL